MMSFVSSGFVFHEWLYSEMNSFILLVLFFLMVLFFVVFFLDIWRLEKKYKVT